MQKVEGVQSIVSIFHFLWTKFAIVDRIRSSVREIVLRSTSQLLSESKHECHSNFTWTGTSKFANIISDIAPQLIEERLSGYTGNGA